jgi:hypothetical protein
VRHEAVIVTFAEIPTAKDTRLIEDSDKTFKLFNTAFLISDLKKRAFYSTRFLLALSLVSPK